MKLTVSFLKTYFTKTTAFLALLLLAALIVSGAGGALAFLYDPGYQRLEEISSHTGLSGRLRGSGLAPLQGVEVTFIAPDGSITKAAAETGTDGAFVLQNFGFAGPEASAIEVSVRFERKPGSPPQAITFNLDNNLSALEVTGKGLERGKTFDVFLASGGVPGRSVAADRSGAFRSGAIRKSGMLAGGDEACVSFGEGPEERVQICFGLSLSSNGYFSLAQAGGSLLSSPFSTWQPPSDTAPAGTLLSVGHAEHIAEWKNDIVETYVRALMSMTEQFSVVMVQQMEVIGAFLDAKHQLEVQRWIQARQAEAHSDYVPSRQICYYATFIQDMTSLTRLSEYNVEAINGYMFDREMGPAIDPTETSAMGTGAPGGEDQDRYTRLRQLNQLYCSPDNNDEGGMRLMCEQENPERVNRDIDFSRIESETTLDINFEEDDNTGDETDILAMSKYLFSHDLLQRPDRLDLFAESTAYGGVEGGPLNGVRKVMDIRSIIAVRGLMRDSFANIVAMRSSGEDGLSTEYITAYLENMGMDADAIKELIGEDPSEMGILNVLMNVMPQNPHFYTETYDSDVNVERTRAAMQAVKNLGGRKAFEASLRREMLISARLEMRLRDVHEEINAFVQAAINSYKKN